MNKLSPEVLEKMGITVEGGDWSSRRYGSARVYHGFGTWVFIYRVA